MRAGFISRVVAGFAAAVLASACTGAYKSDFQLIVVNKTVNTIQVMANGNPIGQVTTGQSGTFSVELTESNANEFTNGVAPTPQASVAVAAKDLKTGVLSTPKSLSLTQSTPTYVTFTAADFASTGPTVATFTFSPPTPTINQDVFFNASASTPANGTYAWNFGDGTTGSGVTITHQFSRESSFAVTLTVTNDTGVSATASRTVTVSTTLPPIGVTFTFSPAVPLVNQDVIFNASTSTVTGTFNWDFGDGGTGTGVIITHRFARNTTYAVNLRVTNSSGQTAATSKSVTVLATPVIASFTVSPANPAINQDVFFNASGSIASNPTYAWDFGDGSRTTGVSPSHRFGTSGAFVVLLTVTSDTGVSNTQTRTVNVSATSGQVFASFTFSPVSPGINQDVAFNASASIPQTGTFTWNFGDEQTGIGVTPVHRYAQAAAYTVTLTVSNSFGQSNTTNRTVTVSATSPTVTASFTFSPTTPGINQDVFFNASASNPSNGTFAWNFGDGSTGTGVTPIHRYTQASTYTVTMTITNGFGQSNTASRTVPVSATSAQLVADFTFSPTDPTISRGTTTVNFDATPSSAGVTTWTWDFGDSSTGSGQKISHTFTQAGTWVVRLTVGDSTGRTATTTKNVTVCTSISSTGACQ